MNTIKHEILCVKEDSKKRLMDDYFSADRFSREIIQITPEEISVKDFNRNRLVDYINDIMKTLRCISECYIKDWKNNKFNILLLYKSFIFNRRIKKIKKLTDKLLNMLPRDLKYIN